MTLFLIISVVNGVTLVCISMAMLWCLRKKYVGDQKTMVEDLTKREAELRDLIEEFSNLATSMYGDLQEKERLFSAYIDEMRRGQEKNGVSYVKEQVPVVLETKTTSLESQHIRKAMEWANESIQQKIYSLADNGLSILEIAKTVEKPRGEIELMLHLRKVSHAAHETA